MTYKLSVIADVSFGSHNLKVDARKQAKEMGAMAKV